MLTFLWNSCVLLMHFLGRMHSYHHQVLCHTGNLVTGRQENSPGLLRNSVILLHNSAWPRTTQQTWTSNRLGTCCRSSAQEMLDHPPHIVIWYPAVFSVSHLKGALVRTIPPHGLHNRNIQLPCPGWLSHSVTSAPIHIGPMGKRRKLRHTHCVLWVSSIKILPFNYKHFQIHSLIHFLRRMLHGMRVQTQYLADASDKMMKYLPICTENNKILQKKCMGIFSRHILNSYILYKENV
jgi:hypothetical protein